MCSIRKPRRSLALSLAVVAGTTALAALGTGCSYKPPAPKPDAVDTTPMPVDEAMQVRDWPRTTAEFKSGGTVAGATRFPYNPGTVGDGSSQAIGGPERTNAVVDTVAFVLQTGALPFTYLFDPPFVKREHYGVTYEPSYTLMPVLPADESPAPDAYQSTPAPEPTAEPSAEPTADERASIPATADPKRVPEEGATIPATTPPAPTEAVPPGETPPGETPPEAKPPVISPVAPDASAPAPSEPSKEPTAVPPPQSDAAPAPEAPPAPAVEPPAAPAPEAPAAPEPPPTPPEPNK
jgi:hypothetical protein